MKKARKIMVVILAIVFAVSLGHLIRNAVNYRAGADNYSSAQEIAGITETPEEQPEEEEEEEEVVDPLVKTLRSVDLAALQAVNPEVKAWIHIPSILQCSAFYIVQLSHSYIITGKTIALTRWTLLGKVMSLLFNMLSRFIIGFLPRSKILLISWLQSPSAVIWEPLKIKSVTVSIVSLSICHEMTGRDLSFLIVLLFLLFLLILLF